jgi:hypothetical protein
MLSTPRCSFGALSVLCYAVLCNSLDEEKMRDEGRGDRKRGEERKGRKREKKRREILNPSSILMFLFLLSHHSHCSPSLSISLPACLL